MHPSKAQQPVSNALAIVWRGQGTQGPVDAILDCAYVDPKLDADLLVEALAALLLLVRVRHRVVIAQARVVIRHRVAVLSVLAQGQARSAVLLLHCHQPSTIRQADGHHPLSQIEGLRTLDLRGAIAEDVLLHAH